MLEVRPGGPYLTIVSVFSTAILSEVPGCAAPSVEEDRVLYRPEGLASEEPVR
jgi:hypothetical protein